MYIHIYSLIIYICINRHQNDSLVLCQYHTNNINSTQQFTKPITPTHGYITYFKYKYNLPFWQRTIVLYLAKWALSKNFKQFELWWISLWYTASFQCSSYIDLSFLISESEFLKNVSLMMVRDLLWQIFNKILLFYFY